MEDTEREAQLREHLERRNYAAAVSVAESLGEPAERIKELQEAAIKQHITEYRNGPGAMALAQEFQFSDDDIDRLLEAIIEEVRTSEEKKPPWAGKRYDIKTMKYFDIEEWIVHYRRTLKLTGSR